jgi:hypothetical protein
MDLDRMLEMCRKGQWKVDDLDWSATPRAMGRDEEIAIVQYFTDMAGIERLAGALFEEQRKRAEDETLQKIFATFVADEERHARAAERLARYYDLHHFRTYEMSPSLAAFRDHFVHAVHFLSAEIANVYITAGELILDVALLRSINDYVHDEMSQRAMDLINRDESRHIAVDYHMTEYYASERYQAWLKKQPRQPLAERAKAIWAFANVLLAAKPFFRDVFFLPMTMVDPSGRRLREAFKRGQLLGSKPEVAARPFWRFLSALRETVKHPRLGPLLGGFAARLAGVPSEFMYDLYTDSEYERASTMSYDELANEALAAKISMPPPPRYGTSN